MKFDTQKYSYASRRTVSFAKNGMVATSSPLPAQVGLDVLKKGGNAIDAAVATAAALSVIEPTSNGIGADSFALIWYKGKLYGLNGSGRSPRLISGEKLLEKGLKAVPSDGWDPVMVPGTPSAWAEAVKKFGNLSLSEVLEPAAKYAEDYVQKVDLQGYEGEPLELISGNGAYFQDEILPKYHVVFVKKLLNQLYFGKITVNMEK